MKTMKKRMMRLAAVGIAGTLLVCGCKKQELPAQETQAPVEETAEDEPVEEAPVEETIPLRLHINKNQKTYSAEDSEEVYLNLEYCDVTVEGDGYDNLKRNLEQWSVARSESLRGMYSEYEEIDGVTSTLSQSIRTTRVDPSVVSFLDDLYEYSGGAHGMSYRKGVTFDAQTGKQLSLRDITTDYDTFAEEAVQRILYELKETYGDALFASYEETVRTMWQEENVAWYLDAAGIGIVFEQYCVGPYAMGMVEICLPYAEFEPYIKAAYLPVTADGVAAFPVNEEVSVTLPGNGQKLSMLVESEWQGENIRASLWFGSREMPLNIYAEISHAYLVRTDNEIYCMMDSDLASSDYVTYIYRLTDGILEKVTEFSGSIDAGNINSDSMLMESWVYILGTYGATKTYTFDKNGEFVTEDTEYQLRGNEMVLTTTANLNVTLDEVESTLPAGSHIVLYATDGESYVRFTIPETGQKGVLSVTRNAEGTAYEIIDGKTEYECFAALPYAG